MELEFQRYYAFQQAIFEGSLEKANFDKACNEWVWHAADLYSSEFNLVCYLKNTSTGKIVGVTYGKAMKYIRRGLHLRADVDHHVEYWVRALRRIRRNGENLEDLNHFDFSRTESINGQHSGPRGAEATEKIREA